MNSEMQMHERLIAEPISIEDFAAIFKNRIGSFEEVDNRKMFAGWLQGIFKLKEIGGALGIDSDSHINYYQREHHAMMETNELYRRKFSLL